MQRARELRKRMSLPERMLWSRVRNSKLGFVVRRQYAIGPYVADFYIYELRLCVEVDGKDHDMREEHDEARDNYFKRMGITTIRIAAKAIFADLDGVAESLYFGLRERAGLAE